MHLPKGSEVACKLYENEENQFNIFIFVSYEL